MHPGSGSFRRHRLDWDRPALPQVAAWLLGTAGGLPAEGDRPDAAVGSAGIERSGAAPGIDLADTIVVLPGSRASRLLLWHLAGAAATADGRSGGPQLTGPLAPPRMITPGRLLEAIAPAVALADETQRVLAWAEALRALPPAARGSLLPDADADDPLAWLPLAEEAIRAADELAGARRSFDDAARAAQALGGDRLPERESARWRALAAAATAVAARLADVGLVEPALGAHRRLEDAAAAHRPPRRVVLALVAELNSLQREAIERLAAGGTAIEVLVHADGGWDARLDEFGCVCLAEPSSGRERLQLEEDELVVAEGAADAAQATIDALAAAEGEATIGLLDESLQAILVQAGRWAGLSVRPAAARGMRTTEPWAVVEALARWLRGDRSVVALARLPAVERWLRDRLGLPLEGEAGRDLVALLEDARRGRRPGAPRSAREAVATAGAAERLVEELVAPLADGSARSLSAWAMPLRRVLATLLEAIDEGPVAEEAIGPIDAELARWASLPEALDVRVPGAAAAALLGRRLAPLRLPAPRRRSEIEALGWLELHPDDAPTLVLLGLHEGAVPRVVGADLLLPRTLRDALGLPGDAAAEARDAYLLAAMRRGRRRFRVVVSRRSPTGDPVLASRLLLRVPDADLPRRLQRLAGADSARFAAPAGLAAPAAASAFEIPRPPAAGAAPPVLRVTAFRDYLACPYRFWLRHILGLEAPREPGEQFDPAEFGTFAHEILRRWGGDEAARTATDPARILAALEDRLEELLAELFGRERPVPIAVQAARLRQRFAAFAHAQAEHRRAGWSIEAVEWPLPPEAALAIPGEPEIRIAGRIDRVDRHRDGRVLLLDYKTADSGSSARAVHTGRTRGPAPERWLDLQLPLYAWLAAAPLGVADPARVRTGYALLPRRAPRKAFDDPGWSSDEIDAAIDVARWVVQSIRAGHFAMNPDFRGIDDFAAICQVRALGRGEQDEEEPS